MADAISPVCPVTHTFEWDARRRRIAAIRFQMSDGSERVIGARTVIGDAPDAEPEPDEWRVDVRV